MLNADVEDPALDTVRSPSCVANTHAHERRTSSQFTPRGFEGGASVELIPWFRLTHERYNLYWQRRTRLTGSGRGRDLGRGPSHVPRRSSGRQPPVAPTPANPGKRELEPFLGTPRVTRVTVVLSHTRQDSPRANGRNRPKRSAGPHCA